MIDALKKLGVDVEKQLKVANMSSDFYKKASSLTTANTSCCSIRRPK